MDITYIIESALNAQEAITTVVDSTNVLSETVTTFATGDQAKMGAFIGAGIAMIAATGVGLSQGYAAAQATMAVSRNAEAKPAIMSTMIVGLAIAESSAIYSLIVAILLIFVAPGV